MDYESLREDLSSCIHDIWSGWAKDLVSTKNEDGTVTISKDRIDRWIRQIDSPYSGLSEEEQNLDKVEADKIMKIVRPQGTKTAKLGGTYKYSSTQIQIPDEIANEIKTFGLEIPDDDIYDGEERGEADRDAWNQYGRENDFHITVKYGLHDSVPEKLIEIMRNVGPIEVALGKVSIFPNEGHDVVKVDVHSQGLHDLNKLISDGLECTDSFPGYKPHATIAYVKKGRGSKYTGSSKINGHNFKVNEIVFSNSDGKRYTIHLPPSQQGEKGKELVVVKTTQEKVSAFMEGVKKDAGAIRDRNRNIAQAKVWSGIDPNLSPGRARSMASMIERLPFLSEGAVSRATGDPMAIPKGAEKKPGSPDGTGPYGRGAGPGKGSKSGIGLIVAKTEKGEKLTKEEKKLYDEFEKDSLDKTAMKCAEVFLSHIHR